MFGDYVTAAIRTLTPMLAGSLLAWAVRQGVPVDEGFRQPLTEVLTFAFSGAYYLGVRAAERKWPAAGWLLGVPRRPVYPAPPVS